MNDLKCKMLSREYRNGLYGEEYLGIWWIKNG